MAKDETKRIRPNILAEDKDSLAALKKITDYAPANPAYTAAALTTLQTNVDSAQEAEAQALAALAAARDSATAAEWAFHNGVVGMRDQVVAQYGRESNNAQSVGRKKPSERRAPKRKTGQK